MLRNFRKYFKHRNVIYNLKPYEEIAKKVNALDYAGYSESEFKIECQKLKNELNNVETNSDVVIGVYALIKEAIYRTLKIQPYDVQVIAGIAMIQGLVVEMKTGEGKTLAAVFPICVNALMGKKVNVLTSNDYLAQRDCEWMGGIYRYFGLTASYISETMSLAERKEVYKNEIVYLTVKESGFDYLKNFLCTNPEAFIQRDLDFALVDEADSILIDEARIPLVIAGVAEEIRDDADPFYLLAFIENLNENEDYECNDYDSNVSLTASGIEKCERFLAITDLYSVENMNYLADLTQALEAEFLYKKDVDYIVNGGTVYQVDAFTGRVTEDRKWPQGLQEAIEAKERILPQVRSKICAQISIENFIKLYSEKAGMTGTAIASADEFFEKYNLDILAIPTHNKSIRVDHKDSLFAHKEAKYNAIIEEIAKEHARKRPILVGSYSVEESEYIAHQLHQKNIQCQVLNAKNNDLEAQIVAEAGGLSAVTVSTNMAGRGTDIKLGGKDEKYRDEVARLGGLYVIGTNRHESIRIDEQLRGRAGRQGDCGESRFFVCLEDDLLSKYGIAELIPEELYPQNKNNPLDIKVIDKRINHIQRVAQGCNQRIRTNISNYSVVLEEQRQKTTKLREDILFGRNRKDIIKEHLPKKYEQLRKVISEEAIHKAEQQVLLYIINQYWTLHLESATYLRETIGLVILGKKDPCVEHDKLLYNGYVALLEEIEEEVIRQLSKVKIGENGIDMENEGLISPSSTLTYLLNNNAEAFGMDSTFDNPIASIAMGPLLIPTLLFKKFGGKRKKTAH